MLLIKELMESTHNEKIERNMSMEGSSSAELLPSTSSELPQRSLRKRKLNLNTLSATITCPTVCQFSNCGIRLPNANDLEWHYEGHFAQELEKLEKIRIRKPSELKMNEVEGLSQRRPLRDSAVERIRFNREKRLANKASNRYANI